MNIRAKMKCQTVTLGEGIETVAMTSVYSNDPNSENAKWSKWTPVGQLTLQISNPDAHGAFKPGVEYFVDISPVA